MGVNGGENGVFPSKPFSKEMSPGRPPRGTDFFYDATMVFLIFFRAFFSRRDT